MLGWLSDALTWVGTRLFALGTLLALYAGVVLALAVSYWLVADAGLETWQAVTQKAPAIADGG